MANEKLLYNLGKLMFALDGLTNKLLYVGDGWYLDSVTLTNQNTWVEVLYDVPVTYGSSTQLILNKWPIIVPSNSANDEPANYVDFFTSNPIPEYSAWQATTPQSNWYDSGSMQVQEGYECRQETNTNSYLITGYGSYTKDINATLDGIDEFNVELYTSGENWDIRDDVSLTDITDSNPQYLYVYVEEGPWLVTKINADTVTRTRDLNVYDESSGSTVATVGTITETYKRKGT